MQSDCGKNRRVTGFRYGAESSPEYFCGNFDVGGSIDSADALWGVLLDAELMKSETWSRPPTAEFIRGGGRDPFEWYSHYWHTEEAREHKWYTKYAFPKR